MTPLGCCFSSEGVTSLTGNNAALSSAVQPRNRGKGNEWDGCGIKSPLCRASPSVCDHGVGKSSPATQLALQTLLGVNCCGIGFPRVTGMGMSEVPACPSRAAGAAPEGTHSSGLWQRKPGWGENEIRLLLGVFIRLLVPPCKCCIPLVDKI